jgi:hypothetical protein
MKRSAGLTLLLIISACGGSSSPSSPSPVPVVRNIEGAVTVFGSTYHPLTITNGGSVTVSLNWGSSVDLDLYISQSGCTALYPKANCAIINQSNGLNKPETVTAQLGPGSYKVWVDNMSLSSGTSYTLTSTTPFGNISTATTVPVEITTSKK